MHYPAGQSREPIINPEFAMPSRHHHISGLPESPARIRGLIALINTDLNTSGLVRDLCFDRLLDNWEMDRTPLHKTVF
jgi:hypothetical protein